MRAYSASLRWALHLRVVPTRVQGMAEPQAAVVMVRCSQPEPAVLLIRRAVRPGDPWSGHWGLPGGRREAADGSLEMTARRELAEEVGLQTNRPFVRLPDGLAGRNRLAAPVPVAIFQVDYPTREPLQMQAAEVAGVYWLALATFTDHAQHREAFLEGALRPCLPLPGTPLWGFTYATLKAWLLPPPV